MRVSFEPSHGQITDLLCNMDCDPDYQLPRWIQHGLLIWIWSKRLSEDIRPVHERRLKEELEDAKAVVEDLEREVKILDDKVGWID